MKVYSGLASVPNGHADTSKLVPGCLVLEGGALRGLYTQGALDALLQNDVNVQTVIGVSAGAMGGVNYLAGQIGRSARINLGYRHDSNYMGLGAMQRDHGITGFTFAFDDYNKIEPLDHEAFNDPRRRFIAVAADIETGKAAYFERGRCSDIRKAVQASATVPFVSEPVAIDGRLYLDGGLVDPIPVDWAIEQGFQKIMVIRTRDHAYRKAQGTTDALIDLEYGNHPALVRALKHQHGRYNNLVNHVGALELKGRIFMLAPRDPITISRFEGDMEKLGQLYWRGYREALEAMPQIKEYFDA